MGGRSGFVGGQAGLVGGQSGLFIAAGSFALAALFTAVGVGRHPRISARTAPIQPAATATASR